MIEGILYLWCAVALAVIGLAGWRLSQSFRRFSRRKLYTTAAVVTDMPSVTVCIPARNESHAMTDALQRVLASTYPKLEIIVLDDLSADKTPALVKAFAHEGVRFIEGGRLPDGWLGKNHALNILLKEASGSLILFLDVDTHIEPDSIEQLVAYMTDQAAEMVSVLPRRSPNVTMSTVLEPLRYFWELMFHRKDAPAVASNAWMVRRQTFVEDFHDFDKLKAVIQPEAHVAALYMAQNKYRFLLGSKLLGISQQKRWGSQIETSIRLLYPLLGSTLPRAIIAALDLLIVALPSLLLLVSGLFQSPWLGLASLVVYLAGLLVYGAYLQKVWGQYWLLAATIWPLVVIQEAVLIIVSAIQYRRGRVTWKGRHIGLPTAE